MSKKQFIFGLFISSLLSAFLAVGVYTMVQPKPQTSIVLPADQKVSFTKYVPDTNNFVIPEGLNFIYASQKSTPAVVHIKSMFGSDDRPSSKLEELFRDYLGDGRRPNERRGGGTGSGVILSNDGYIVTNNHVVEGASNIQVVLNDNREFETEVIGTDPTTDLALLKIEAINLSTLEFGNSENLQIGEWVLAVGNPFDFRSTVTAGIVSAKARNINILRDRNNLQIESFIQTDAAVNPGNSGGALVNLKGELIGINTAIATPTGTFAGYSFAVPVSLVQKVVFDLKEFGVVQRAILGIQIRDNNSELAEEEDLNVVKGVYIDEVRSGSAAEEIGLERGDVIVGIGDKTVSNVSELQEQVALNRPGDQVRVIYIHDGKRLEANATLKNTLGNTNIVKVNNTMSMDGASFAELNRDEKEQYALEGGIKITKIKTGKWEEAGIKVGFIITRIDKRSIKTLEDFTAAVDKSAGDGMLIEGIYPNGDKAYYGLGW